MASKPKLINKIKTVTVTVAESETATVMTVTSEIVAVTMLEQARIVMVVASETSVGIGAASKAVVEKATMT